VRTVLITGVAGFIGSHLAHRLLDRGDIGVIGADSINSYYDTELKEDRLSKLESRELFSFNRLDISDQGSVRELFGRYKFDYVINLAAQAGVRYSKENPKSYIDSNIIGFYNIISASAANGVQNFLYASSSSVYGSNTSIPFKESDAVDTPMSLYAATKISNEALASSYYYSYGLKTIGMRFFNVYGAWGRPDMAYYKWADALVAGDEIELRESGNMWRDMTYVDDVVEAIDRLMSLDEISFSKPEVFNIGNRSPVKISDMLDCIASGLSIVPKVKIVPKGEEEPIKTWADTSKLYDRIGFMPNTDYRYGLSEFIKWYKDYKN
jgi:UDP-glucuronate 4-epimerase